MRSAATSAAALVAVAPSVAAAAPPPPAASDFIPRVVITTGGPLAPSIGLAIRGSGSERDAALAGPQVRLYRVVPELSVAIHPAPGVELFAGAGAGPAFVLPGANPPRLVETDLALSATIGARVPWLGVPLTAAVRAEMVVGQGAAVMLRLTILDPLARVR